ncbi:unnamed protein product [Rotaria socialis]|uniref:Uncharacterized protein n=1 Tax=Rotaria socialis TaxID=392032 RepID=A0A820EK08_9BILA|nr:unnamed protein product [Rotaria socialis]CAF4338815.1 unnamed protein product [Rotaria socialis]CAF4483707.1 unnamed protein product [Rotaria socialis]CAF4536503.1 unnamed protein product [Rotaria socialis]CAF4638414.1 unnamed protein product [Rotaria socialis]
MAKQNTNIGSEMNETFEKMHLRLDQRFQQLNRQVNIHSTSLLHSRKNSGTPLVFSPIHQRRLEEAINNFGRLTISTSLNNIQRCDTSTLHQQPMRKTTVKAPTKIEDNNNSNSNDNYQTIGKRGRQKGQFSNPQDVLITTNPARTILVSDTINQNVQLFSLDTGLCTGSFLSPVNSKHNALRRPIGLSNSLNNSSTCFVADYDQHLISSWTIDENGNGRLLKKFGQQSLIGPKGLCISNQSQSIVVADNKANSICLFNSSGVLSHRFGTRGSELHELAGPHYVKFAEQDNDRNIIVTDFYNNCVKIFDIERHGQFVTSFGSVGTKNGLFQAPTGLAIDYERGYIFVSDWGNNRIQVFDRQGSFIRIIELSTADLLYGPQGLDYEPSTRTLAIANAGQHCAILVNIV